MRCDFLALFSDKGIVVLTGDEIREICRSSSRIFIYFYLIHSQLHKIHRVPGKRQSYRIQL